MDDKQSRLAEQRRVWYAVIVAWLAALVAVNLVAYVPTHDGPQHIYLGHLLNHFSDPGSIYPLYFRPARPLAALGFSSIFCPLDDVLGWQIAFRLSLSVIVSMWGWSVWALARTIDPRRAIVGVMGFATAFQWTLYMGFFSWMISMALGLGTLAVALRLPWSVQRRVLIALLLAIHAVAHPFPALVTSLVLVTLVLFHHATRRWWRELIWLALMGIPVVLVIAYANGWFGSETVSLPAGEPSPERSFAMVMRDALNLFVGGPYWRSIPVSLATAFAVGWGAWRWKTRRSGATDRALWLVGSLLLLIYFLAPLHLGTWEFFSPRFLAPASLLLWVALPLETLSRTAYLVVFSLVCVHGGAALAWSTRFHRELFNRSADILALAREPIRRHGPRLPMIVDTRLGYGNEMDRWYPYFEPSLNVGTLFAIEQGGVVPYTFTSVPQLHGLVFSEEGKSRMPAAPYRQVYGPVYRAAVAQSNQHVASAAMVSWASFGSSFEDVVYIGPRHELETLVSRGYRVEKHRGDGAILRFEGCPTDVAVMVSGPLPHALTVEYGWLPVTLHSYSMTAPTGTQPIENKINFSFSGMPCGPVWVRAWLDRDDTGTLTSADRVCNGTDREGRMHFEITHETRHVVCSLD